MQVAPSPWGATTAQDLLLEFMITRSLGDFGSFCGRPVHYTCWLGIVEWMLLLRMSIGMRKQRALASAGSMDFKALWAMGVAHDSLLSSSSMLQSCPALATCRELSDSNSARDADALGLCCLPVPCISVACK